VRGRETIPATFLEDLNPKEGVAQPDVGNNEHDCHVLGQCRLERERNRKRHRGCVYLCVRVCVCVGERGRERERGHVCVYVCTCMHVRVCVCVRLCAFLCVCAPACMSSNNKNDSHCSGQGRLDCMCWH